MATDSTSQKLEKEVEEFHDLHDDNWNGIVDTGIPLYQKLKAAGRGDLAQKVKDTLSYTSRVMENSGHDSPNLRERIKSAIN
jgi:hypothetical protein